MPLDEEERRALAALAARVGSDEGEDRPPPRGLLARVIARWSAGSEHVLRRTVGSARKPPGERHEEPWPPLGTYVDEDAARGLRAAARSVGQDREAAAQSLSSPPQAPSPLIEELSQAAAAVGRADGGVGPRSSPDVTAATGASGMKKLSRSLAAMSDGEKAYCIVSPLPWIAALAADLYLLGRGGGAGAEAAGLMLIAPVLLSYLLTGLGALLIFFARRKGRPALAIGAATLVAASLLLWWIVSALAILFGRAWLASL